MASRYLSSSRHILPPRGTGPVLNLLSGLLLRDNAYYSFVILHGISTTHVI